MPGSNEWTSKAILNYLRRKGVLLSAFVLVCGCLVFAGCDEKEKRQAAEKYAIAADKACSEQRYTDAQALYSKSLENNKLNLQANLGAAKLADCWQQDNPLAIQYYTRCLDLPLEQETSQQVQQRIDLLKQLTSLKVEDPSLAATEILAIALHRDQKHLTQRLTPQGSGAILAAGGVDSFIKKLQPIAIGAPKVVWRDFIDADTALVILSCSGSDAVSLVLKKNSSGLWLLDNFKISS